MNCPQPLTHLSGGAIPFMTIPFIYNQQQQQQQQPSSSFQISLQHPTSSSTSPSFQQMQMSLQQPYHQISLQSPQISLQSPSFQQISLQQPHFQQPMGSPYSTPFTSCSMPSSSSFPSFNNNINCNINAINTNVQSACAPSLFPGIIKETKKQPLLTPTFLKVASPSAVAKVLQEDVGSLFFLFLMGSFFFLGNRIENDDFASNVTALPNSNEPFTTQNDNAITNKQQQIVFTSSEIYTIHYSTKNNFCKFIFFTITRSSKNNSTATNTDQ
eukprot:TRINITY_DN1085_c0_g2_i2.p1 TRINITY_DN1085_c0_g2~~TRINITY_DN1085_c0_g2_i2.p1  ORF type:complete len:271 (+),score=93.20 TRINITY_DN1085_c0_g2_i2:96-908(+)